MSFIGGFTVSDLIVQNEYTQPPPPLYRFKHSYYLIPYLRGKALLLLLAPPGPSPCHAHFLFPLLLGSQALPGPRILVHPCCDVVKETALTLGADAFAHWSGKLNVCVRYKGGGEGVCVIKGEGRVQNESHSGLPLNLTLKGLGRFR